MTTIPPRPMTMTLNPAGLPHDSLLLGGGIVGWRWTWVAAKGKYDKPPKRAIDNGPASVTNPADWADGIGLVLEKHMRLVGIDLDKCRDATTGEIASWARAIIERFASYWEPSASGTGIRIFIRGQLPPGRRRSGQIEVYDDGRYLTINGNPGPGSSARFEERQAELDAWFAEVFPAPPVDEKRYSSTPPQSLDLDDEDLLARAFVSKRGGAFAQLHHGGNILGNASEDDFAYLGDLRFWTQGDSGRMRRIALASGRVRDKWFTRRGAVDWLDYSIANSLKGSYEVYDPGRASGQRIAFALPDVGELEVSGNVALLAEYRAVIARLEDEVERLAEQNAARDRRIVFLESENAGLREEVEALEAASRHTDQTIGGAVPDVYDEAIRSYERGVVLVQNGKDYAKVVHKQAAEKGRRSAQTISKCIDTFERTETIEAEGYKGRIPVDYVFIPPELRVPEKRGRALLHLLPPPAEKKHGGPRRKRELPTFDELAEGPIEIKTETKQIYREVATEKVLKVTPLETRTEYCDPEGYQLTIDEVNAFRESIGQKIKVPAYRPQVVPKQMALSEADRQLLTRDQFDNWLDEEPPAPTPLRGKDCLQPGCELPPVEHGFCSRHAGMLSLMGAG
jgi:hypothetical protein